MAERLLPGSPDGRKDAGKRTSSGLETGRWSWAFLAQRYRFSSELVTSRSLTGGLNYFRELPRIPQGGPEGEGKGVGFFSSA